MWVFIILFAILGVVSSAFPKITRFLYSWGSLWFSGKETKLSRIRIIGVGYLIVAIILWLYIY